MIPVQNIYYMLSYAFQVLNEQGYRKIAAEKFHNTTELCAEIIIVAVNRQIKNGIEKEYVPRLDDVVTVRGKINISESIKKQVILRKQLTCEYDEFSVNTYKNRIIKSTMLLLLKSNIKVEQKEKIRKLLLYFSDVNILDVRYIDWNINFNRNNKSYRLLISICYLIIKGLLQMQKDGSITMKDYFDEQRMCRLYEKFILEYYKKEFPSMDVSSSQIQWCLDDEYNNCLPIMQSDIMVSHKNNILIIDAKYYSNNIQSYHEKKSIISGNLYQIFTYVKNLAFNNRDKNVSGLLLYAKTDSDVQVEENTYFMSGNKIGTAKLDLNCDFSEIKKQLDNIILDNFADVF